MGALPTPSVLLTLARVIARHAVAVERLAALSGARQRAIPIG
jgi:hypothetical protein